MSEDYRITWHNDGTALSLLSAAQPSCSGEVRDVFLPLGVVVSANELPD